MDNFKIFIGAHGAAAIIFFAPDNVNFADIKRVGGADDGADVEIVFDVFDGDFEASALFAQGVKNLFVCETFVFVDEVSGVFHTWYNYTINRGGKK